MGTSWIEGAVSEDEVARVVATVCDGLDCAAVRSSDR
jgi:hypothetical protein